MSNFYRVGVKADKKNNLPEKVIIPTRQGQVIAIADEGFKDCVNLKEVVLPETTKFMGVNVFSGCDSLEVISIQKTEKEIQALNWPTNWNNSIEVIYKPAVKYLVSVNSPYGSVTGLNEDRLYEAGDQVTFKVEVNNGYTLETVKCNDIELVAIDEQYSFEMPSQSVIITIIYKPEDDPDQPEVSSARFYTYDDNGDRKIESLTLSTNTINSNTLNGYNFTIASKFTTDEYIIYSPYPVQQIYIKGIGDSWGTETWTNNGTEELDGYIYYKYSLIPAQLVSTSSVQFCAVTI